MVPVNLPDEYGEEEVEIAVKQLSGVDYVDRFIDLGRIPMGNSTETLFEEIKAVDLMNEACLFITTELEE